MGIGPIDWASRRAIVLRSWVSGTSVNGVPSAGNAMAGRAGAAAGRGAAAVAVAVAGRAGAPSRSRSTTRPSGPDPERPARSIPRSAAMRRASGDALMRPPGEAAGAADGGTALRAAVGVSPAAFAGGAGGIETGRLRSAVGWVACSCAAVGFPFSTASPGSPMSATSSETGTVVPAGTTCLSRVPPARATSSMTALSVSTSASTSPTATASPSPFFHSTRRPSSIVGESASMTTLVAMAQSRYSTEWTAATTLAGSTFAAFSSCLL